MSKQLEFMQALTKRGLGLFGRDRMLSICERSNINLLADDTIEVNGDLDQAVNDLMVNFAEGNLIAKMTAQTLAKKYQMPIPQEFSVKKSKRKSRLRNIFDFGRT